MKLNEKECLDLLSKYNTPKHVINHCKAVSKVAFTIASALNTKGYSLDADLCKHAGLLHDMARVEDHHGEVAADKLSELGYIREAEIIRVHMYHNEFNPIEKISEKDIVCISDRVVKEGDYVGFKIRMAHIRKKANYSPEVLKILDIKEKQLSDYIDSIESIIGSSFDDLMEGIHEKD
ncbi:MAG: HDIG domain-containing protein [Anaerovoracaceae bacterium]